MATSASTSCSSARGCSSRTRGPGLRDPAAHGDTVDAVHQVERGAEHRRVVATEEWSCDRHRFVLDRVEDAELPQHVVGRGRARVAGRAPQDPTPAIARDRVDVARSAADHRLDGEGGAVAEPLVEERPQRVDGFTHPTASRSTISTTCPSRSMTKSGEPSGAPGRARRRRAARSPCPAPAARRRRGQGCRPRTARPRGHTRRPPARTGRCGRRACTSARPRSSSTRRPRAPARAAADQRVHLVDVDVRHDLDAHALRPEVPQRRDAVVPQHRGVERGPVLTVDQIGDRGRCQRTPQRPCHLHERASEQLTVEVVRPRRHLPVRVRQSAAVGGSQLVVRRGHADRVADETQLLEVHVAERARAEQRAGEVEEHGAGRTHRAEAATRSACHFSSAAARRLGMCSVGQPSTGV